MISFIPNLYNRTRKHINIKKDDLTILENYRVKDTLILFNQTYRFEGADGWKHVAFFIDIKGKKKIDPSTSSLACPGALFT